MPPPGRARTAPVCVPGRARSHSPKSLLPLPCVPRTFAATPHLVLAACGTAAPHYSTTPPPRSLCNPPPPPALPPCLVLLTLPTPAVRSAAAAAAMPDLDATIIWCHPRSCSTAFERAFMQRADTITYHEPLGDAFYWGPQRQCLRFSRTSIEREHSDVQEPLLQTLAGVANGTNASGRGADEPQGKRFVFAKDMAQYIFPTSTLSKLHPQSRVYHASSTDYELSPGVQPLVAATNSPDDSYILPDGSLAPDFASRVFSNPTVVPNDLLRKFNHTFLIRTPEKGVPSYYKCCKDGAAGFEYFDPAEAGYKEQAILYAYLTNPESEYNRGSPQAARTEYPLIDAAVLLKQPDVTVRNYCGSVGIPFEDSMLKWEAHSSPEPKQATDDQPNDSPNGSATAEFAKWGSYHAVAEQSTGFRSDAGAAAKNAPTLDLPKEVQDAIKCVVPSRTQL